MEEELKNIKVSLDYYDENCVKSEKQFTIRVNKLRNCEERGFGWSKRLFDMTFSMQVPQHIHDYLIGKEVPINTMSNRNHLRSYKNFSKTITQETVKLVCETYWGITQDYLWLKGIEKADLTKVIFYSLKCINSIFRSDYSGLDFGDKNDLHYKYAVGYVSIFKNEVSRYNKNKVLVSKSNDSDFNSMKFVNWSDERELFFSNLKKSFDGIVSKINTFESNLNEISIDDIISNTPLLLTN